MRKFFIYLIPIGLFGFNQSLFAQQRISLDEALLQMRMHNAQLKVQQHEVELGQADVKSGLSGFLPKLSVAYSGFYTNDPLNVFGFKLQNRIVNPADFNPALLNDPSARANFNTKFSLQQPLINFDAITARKALDEKLKASQYQKEFVEKTLSVEIKNTYTNLQFLYEARKAVLEATTAYKETLRNTENMSAQGYARHSDVLQVRVGLAELKTKDIELSNNINNLSDYLNWLMGKEANEIYQPSTALQQDLSPLTSKNLNSARADLKAYEHGIAARKSMTSVQKNTLLPRVNAFAEYNLNDKKAFNFGANSYLVGLVLSWDIFNGNYSLNKLKQSKIELQKAEAEQKVYVQKNQLALQKALRDLQANQASIEQAQTAQAQAGESLRILQNRYNEGLEKTADLLAAQAKDIEKKVSYLNAIKDFNLTKIQIDFLTQ